MRKQTKLVAVLSAASLLAIGASMTAFAATPHWDQEDGEWVYLDRNGDKVAAEWKKSNGQWYYLDDDGYMAKDQLIEYGNYKYYVDANGVKVTNAWVSMDNDDLLDDEDVSTVWYYFDSKGKAVGCNTDEGAIKKLNYGDGQSAYFIFNNEGVMLSGWQRWSKTGEDQKLYYLGDENEGWARTGWQYLDIEGEDEIFGVDEEGNPFESENWFWFDGNGRAKTNGTKTIGGRVYAFNEVGIMQDLWVYSTNSNLTNTNGSSSVASSAAYYKEDQGDRDKNWIYAYAKTGYEDYSEDPYWFYLDSKGRPFRADQDAIDANKLEAIGTAERLDDSANDPATCDEVAAKAIKSKTYLFNDKGVMLTGLYKLEGVHKGTAEKAMETGIYYFTEEEGSAEGQMVTNKKITIDVNGEDETYYFDKTGKAYTNTLISGSLYGSDGALVTDHGDGSTYETMTITDAVVDKSGDVVIEANTTILVNGNGKVKQSGTVTDINGTKYKVTKYVAVEVEDNN